MLEQHKDPKIKRAIYSSKFCEAQTYDKVKFFPFGKHNDYLEINLVGSDDLPKPNQPKPTAHLIKIHNGHPERCDFPSEAMDDLAQCVAFLCPFAPKRGIGEIFGPAMEKGL